MGDVIDLQPGDIFDVKIVYGLDSDPFDERATTLQYQCTNEEVETATVELLATRNASMVNNMLLAGHARVRRVIVSTWEPDSQPYTTASFATFEFNDPGQRPIPEDVDPAPGNMVLLVGKTVKSGRTGRYSLRYSLLVTDLKAQHKRWIFASPGTMQGLVEDAWESSDCILYVTGYPGKDPAFTLGMARAIPGGNAFRYNYALKAKKPTNLKLDNEYYDRA